MPRDTDQSTASPHHTLGTRATQAAAGNHAHAGALTDPTTTKGDLIVHGTVLDRLAVGTDGQVLTADSTQTLGVHWAAASGGGGGGVPVDVQAFTSNGTWTKPSGVTTVEVIVIGGGGGGGSGRRGATSTTRGGGGGGGGGGLTQLLLKAADVPATVAVTVGGGGAGALAASVDNTNGTTGATGGNTTFAALASAQGGAGGGGGSGSSGAGGAGGIGHSTGGAGASAAASAAVDAAGAGGGGCGGSISSGNVNTTGSNAGATCITSTAAGGAGGANTVAGTNGGTTATALQGGGGGGGGTSGANGGAGGNYGGGGGGGGGVLNGSASGVGGAGAAGICVVISWGAGGGSSGGPTRTILKTLHGTYGDDFTAASLDAKWSHGGNSAAGQFSFQVDSDAAAPTWARWTRTGQANGGYIYQTAPAGDFSLIMRHSQQYGTSSAFMTGLVILDTSNNGASAVLYNGSPIGVLAGSVSGSVYGGSFQSIGLSSAVHSAGVPTWLRLRKSGTSYFASASFDGEKWMPETPGLTSAITVARIGIGHIFGSDTSSVTFDIDAFNLV